MLNINKLKWNIPFIFINLLMIENLFEIYGVSIINNSIKVICYFMIVFFGIISIFLLFIRREMKNQSLTMLLYYLYVLYICFINKELNNTILIQISIIPLSYIFSVYFFKKCDKPEKFIKIQTIIYGIMLLLYFYNKMFFHQSGAAKINSIFYLVVLLPFILSLENNKLKKIFIISLLVAAIISMKRTAMVVIIVGIAVYIFKNNSKDKSKIIKFLFSIIAVLLIILFVQKQFNVNIMEKFATSIEDGGSGRSDIYGTLIRLLFTRSLNNITFGEGINCVVNLLGTTAHNDFLEIFFDFGIVGFIMYCYIYINLIRKYIEMKKNSYKFACQYLISIIVLFIMSMLSHMIIIPTYMVFLCMFLGLIENDYKQKEMNNK